MTTEFDYLKNWIINFLNKPQESLNNLPVCPFAKSSLTKNKIFFFKSNNHLLDISNFFNEWDSSYEVGVCVLTSNISADELIKDIKYLNDIFLSKGFCCLEDHIDIPEKFQDICFNNGKYNIILCQETSTLNQASKSLMKKGYYKNWSDEMYKNVVSWRTNL